MFANAGNAGEKRRPRAALNGEKMKLNDVWGYGQLFGFSGLDGVTRYYDDFVGTLTTKKGEIRFELREWVKIAFPLKGKVRFRAITGDMIDAETENGDFFLTFANEDALIGYVPELPTFKGEKGLKHCLSWGYDVYCTSFDRIAVAWEKMEQGYKIAIYHAFSIEEARAGVRETLKNANPEALKAARYAYFEKMPKCKNRKYEKLYYKALSVNKVNVHTPQGNIPCRWTTPNRVPHRHMWLWDSVFHALAMVNYNPEMAKDALRAVLSQTRPDGFIPHMMSPNGHSDVTQPQVLAWGVWNVYKKTGDRAFLAEYIDVLEKYLTWDMEHRDNNKNGLLEWLTEPDQPNCRCGESGLDNSPRFDFDDEMDAVDFSTFAVHDAHYLSLIFAELGDPERAKKWQLVADRIAERINAELWDEKTGTYYDKLLTSGKLTYVLSPLSFLPLFAGIPSKEQAAKMVKLLTDKSKIWTPVPLASISQDHPAFSTDMWRGGVWLNLNYFIIKGLKDYGYDDIAEELWEKTLDTVKKWHKKTGTIFEFYDPLDKIAPYRCERKGKQPRILNWRKQWHSIVDFNWSSCFTLLFIQREFY